VSISARVSPPSPSHPSPLVRRVASRPRATGIPKMPFIPQASVKVGTERFSCRLNFAGGHGNLAVRSLQIASSRTECSHNACREDARMRKSWRDSGKEGEKERRFSSHSAAGIICSLAIKYSRLLRERSRAINTAAFAASWKIYGAVPVRIYPRAFIIKARRRCARRRVD